jgi:hypothetical protein
MRINDGSMISSSVLGINIQIIDTPETELQQTFDVSQPSTNYVVMARAHKAETRKH